MIGRRQFISLLGGAAAVWPFAVRAQQSATPVIGFLSIASPDVLDSRLRAFREGLSEAGFIEGRNVVIEYRWARGQNAQLPALATDLVDRGVSVMVTSSGAAALAAKSTTATIPIVFYVGSDPINLGLIASLNRPGGNLTGMSNLSGLLESKRLELLHEVIPTATVVGALLNPTIAAADTQFRRLRTAAHTLGLELHTFEATTERDFDAAFSAMDKLKIGALVVAGDLFFTSRSEQLAALTLRHALPAISSFREFAAAGGLMSYGSRYAHMYRQVGTYTGRILKGEKPADLPAQQSTEVELVLNLKTAKAFGLTISLPLLGRADEVIE